MSPLLYGATCGQKVAIKQSFIATVKGVDVLMTERGSIKYKVCTDSPGNPQHFYDDDVVPLEPFRIRLGTNLSWYFREVKARFSK